MFTLARVHVGHQNPRTKQKTQSRPSKKSINTPAMTLDPNPTEYPLTPVKCHNTYFPSPPTSFPIPTHDDIRIRPRNQRQCISGSCTPIAIRGAVKKSQISCAGAMIERNGPLQGNQGYASQERVHARARETACRCTNMNNPSGEGQ